MSYFAQGIQQGGEIGARAYLEKKKRDQDSELAKARLTFEADQLRENFKGQGTLQKERLLADAAQADAGRTFQQGEKALDRTYGSKEREAGQTFTAGQNAARLSHDASQNSQQRNLTSSMALENRLAQDARDMTSQLTEARRAREAARQFDDKFSWDKSPDNPENQSRSAYAKRLTAELPPDTTPNATTALPRISPPAAAIEKLRANPAMAEQFRAKYGVDPKLYLLN